jgi:hypothetical protein
MQTHIIWFDSPKVLDCSVTNIPGSGSNPLEVIASTADAIFAISWCDSTGKFIELYAGPAGQEQHLFILAGSSGEAKLRINEGQRISLRNTSTETISRGGLLIAFHAYPSRS